MNKRLDIINLGLKEHQVYGDYCILTNSTGSVICGVQCSIYANPSKICDGGIIAPGSYVGMVTKYHDNTAILINDGKEIPSSKQNPRHKNKRIMSEVFIHRGDSEKNRGSLGCITIRTKYADNFFRMFTDGEKIDINVI